MAICSLGVRSSNSLLKSRLGFAASAGKEANANPARQSDATRMRRDMGNWLLWLTVAGTCGSQTPTALYPSVRGGCYPLIKEMAPDAARASGAVGLERPSAYSKMRNVFSSPPWGILSRLAALVMAVAPMAPN